MASTRQPFDLSVFLRTVGNGKQMLFFQKGQTIFALGDPSDAVFVVQRGLVTLSAKPQGTILIL